MLEENSALLSGHLVGILTSGGSISRPRVIYIRLRRLCLPSDFVRVVTMRSGRSRRTRCRRSEAVYIRSRRTAGSRRVTSRSSSATGLRQLRTLGRDTSVRGFSPWRCRTALFNGSWDPLVEVNRRIPAGYHWCRRWYGLALHKYKPAVTGTIPMLSGRRRSSVNTYLGSNTHRYIGCLRKRVCVSRESSDLFLEQQTFRLFFITESKQPAG